MIMTCGHSISRTTEPLPVRSVGIHSRSLVRATHPDCLGRQAGRLWPISYGLGVEFPLFRSVLFSVSFVPPVVWTWICINLACFLPLSLFSTVLYFPSSSPVPIFASLRQLEIISLGLFIHFWREGEEIFLVPATATVYHRDLVLLSYSLSHPSWCSTPCFLACCSPSPALVPVTVKFVFVCVSCPSNTAIHTYTHTSFILPSCTAEGLSRLLHSIDSGMGHGDVDSDKCGYWLRDSMVMITIKTKRYG